jgi:hypothetical protein
MPQSVTPTLAVNELASSAHTFWYSPTENSAVPVAAMN